MKFRAIALLCLASLFTSSAYGATLHVPNDFATIQAAVNAASAGDTIRVGPGTWCGAVISKTLNLTGDGKPTITNQGCVGPNSFIGFLLPSSAASGTTIRGFNFAVTSAFPSPSFGVFGRNADVVVVEQNEFSGAVVAVHNGDGSGWQVNHNTIEGAFVGIRFARHCQLGTRALDNSAAFNNISQGLTDGNAIWVLGQDGAVIKNNSFEIPSSPNPPFPLFVSWGVLIGHDFTQNACASELTSINSVVVNNDGRNTGVALIVIQDLSGGNGNSVGNQIRGNFGANAVNASFSDPSLTTIKNRSKLIDCDDQGNCS